ncbi:hypothetical protein BKI52_17410 [marine bacterium AO1-C]|nr:hypothetical protein BKI52_17410 [marine bacterium AO1-C]
MKNFSLFVLSLLLMTACISESREDLLATPANPATPINDLTNATIWLGSNITFAKAAGADPQQAVNQDRLTDNVWITRGNNGGEIYNARQENSFSKGSSPVGTEWAVGSINDAANLTFQPFRAAVGSPQSATGKDLVLHLIQDDIYLSVKFTFWGSGKNGRFTYERSTP